MFINYLCPQNIYLFLISFCFTYMRYLPILEGAPHILPIFGKISLRKISDFLYISNTSPCYILYISLFGISNLPTKLQEFPSLFNHFGKENLPISYLRCITCLGFWSSKIILWNLHGQKTVEHLTTKNTWPSASRTLLISRFRF